MKTIALDKFLGKHTDSCTVHVFSGDRHCSCGRDAAVAELELIKLEYMGVIEMCDGLILESEYTEEVELSHGLDPKYREEHRHAYEHIKEIYTLKLKGIK